MDCGWLVFDGPTVRAFAAAARQAATRGRWRLDTREGGSAISYTDEDPNIRKSYEAALLPQAESSMPPWSIPTHAPEESRSQEVYRRRAWTAKTSRTQFF